MCLFIALQKDENTTYLILFFLVANTLYCWELEVDYMCKKISVEIKPTVHVYIARKLNNADQTGGEKSFIIEVKESNPSVYPNVCVPIAGVIEHYRNRGFNIVCSWDDSGEYIDKTHISHPLIINDYLDAKLLQSPLDKVWKFSTPEEISMFVDSICNEVSQRVTVAKGFLPGFEWCLNEVMDNVLQHSEATYGYAMGQLLGQKKRLSICVFDNGRGIFNSLKGSKYTIETPLEAIEKALQECVTRDDLIGQGNGMWGLSRIVLSNAGLYSVSSDGATVGHKDGKPYKREFKGLRYELEGLGTTMIDFQLDYSKRIDIAEELNGIKPVSLWLDGRENAEGECIIRLSKESSGTGTRQAAIRMRNYAFNMLTEGKAKVIFDFDQVSAISSSYADELLGKLVAKMGFSNFMNFFKIINTDTLQRNIIDRSVQQRMAQLYYDKSIPDDPDFV